MKPSAFLVNTARGEIINEDALLEALKNRWISGAAIDVICNEAQTEGLKDNPLVKYASNNTNLIITPHIAGNTFRSQLQTAIFIKEKIEAYSRSIS